MKTAAVALICLGSAVAWSQERPILRTPEQYGRFVVSFSSHARADTFLVDMRTGKTWQLARLTDVVGEPVVWIQMERMGNDAQLSCTQTLKSAEQQRSKPSLNEQLKGLFRNEHEGSHP